MKKFIPISTIAKYLLLVWLFLSNKAVAQTYQWAKDFGGFSSEDANAICTDSLGNVYVAGGFSSTSISIGTITIPNASPGSNDVFIAKYTSSGNVVWAKKVSSTGNDRVTGMCVGNGGYIYVTGMFNGPMLSSGAAFNIANVNAGQDDAYIVRLNSSGTTQYLKGYGSTGSESISGCCYSKKTGYLYVAGAFVTPTLAAGNFTVNNSDAGGNSDVFIAKIDNFGNENWVDVTGDANANDYSSGGIVCDSIGNIYFGGTYMGGSTTIGGSILNSFGGIDIFLTKYSASGIPQWAVDIGSNNSFDGFSDIGIDKSDNILISGNYSGSALNIGAGNLAAALGTDAFYAKYTPSGGFVWAKNITSASNQYIRSIDGDKNNNVYFTGNYNGPQITIGLTTLFSSNPGYNDIFITKCDATGTPLWTSTASGSGDEFANSLALDNVSNLYVTGSYQDIGSTNFGSTTLNSYGVTDVFIAKIGCLSTFITGGTSVCEGSSMLLTASGASTYTWSTGALTPTVSVTPTISTVYTVTGSSGGCVGTPSTFSVTMLPASLVMGPNLNLLCKQSALLSSTCNPSVPSVISWMPATGLSSTTVLSPTVTGANGTKTYTLTVTLSNGCVKSNTVAVTGYAPVPDICQVTVDSLGQNNEIYWEKSLYPTADSFYVYREVALNNWKKIASVSRTAFSMYVDTNRSVGPANGDPNASYYKYRLQMKDSCGNMSVMSKWHETIFIQDQMNGNFNWNSYAIESSPSPVSTYNLKRRTIATGTETLVLSTVGNLGTDVQYNSFWSSNVKWFVDAVGFNCVPSMAVNPKGGNNQIQLTKTKTKSNQSNDKMLSTGIGNVHSLAIIKVYPNPATDILNISVSGYNSEACTVSVKNLLGQEVITPINFDKMISVNIQDVSSGAYFVIISDADGKQFVEQKLIINK